MVEIMLTIYLFTNLDKNILHHRYFSELKKSHWFKQLVIIF